MNRQYFHLKLSEYDKMLKTCSMNHIGEKTTSGQIRIKKTCCDINTMLAALAEIKKCLDPDDCSFRDMLTIFHL